MEMRLKFTGNAAPGAAGHFAEMAKDAAQVAANIIDVNRGACEIDSGSAQVLSSAQPPSNESNRPEAEVGKFLDTVRTA
jgi:hypothetical protein